MDKKGFTLVELIIVVAIIAILALIAIPGYIGQQTRAARAEAYTNLESLRLLEEQFFAENADYAPSQATVSAIQTVLPGFQPGTGLNFTYSLAQNSAIVTPIADPPTYTAQDPCFAATAVGRGGSRVAGETYAIDCNNNKNF